MMYGIAPKDDPTHRSRSKTAPVKPGTAPKAAANPLRADTAPALPKMLPVSAPDRVVTPKMLPVTLPDRGIQDRAPATKMIPVTAERGEGVQPGKTTPGASRVHPGSIKFPQPPKRPAIPTKKPLQSSGETPVTSNGSPPLQKIAPATPTTPATPAVPKPAVTTGPVTPYSLRTQPMSIPNKPAPAPPPPPASPKPRPLDGSPSRSPLHMSPVTSPSSSPGKTSSPTRPPIPARPPQSPLRSAVSQASLTQPHNKLVRTESDGVQGTLYKVHIALTGLDMVKNIPLDPKGTVKQAIETILAKGNVPHYHLHQYILEAPNYIADGYPLNEAERLNFYPIQPDDTLVLKVKPYPQSRMKFVTVIPLEGRNESIQIDLSCLGSLLREAVCETYNYNPETIFLTLEGSASKIAGLTPLKDQGVVPGSVVRVHKKSKKELKKQHNSLNAIKKKVGSTALTQGLVLTVNENYTPDSSDAATHLEIKKGDTIVVTAIDHATGWWKGKLGDKEGMFPVAACKYEEKRPDRGQKLTSWTKVKHTLFKRRGIHEGIIFERYANTVPKIVDDILNYLDASKAYVEEGLFRVSGNLHVIFKLKKEYQKGIPVDWMKLADPHTAAGVLKLFLRDLPEPLLTYELYDAFVTAVNIENESMSLYCIQEALAVLPPGNKIVASRLFAFCYKLSQHQNKSLMGPQNLGVVFAPSLFKPREETLDSIMSVEGQKLIATIIANYPVLFGSAGKLPAPPLHRTTPEFTAMIQRSSTLIEESLKVEKEIISKVTAENKAKNVDNEEDDVIPVLVDCLLEGNDKGVAQYLKTLPQEVRESTQLEVQELFEAILDQQGVPQDSPKRQTVVLQKYEDEY